MTVLAAAVCGDCSDLIGSPAVRSFESYPAMDVWVTTHVSGTAGHRVRSVPGDLSPDEAYARAFGEGT